MCLLTNKSLFGMSLNRDGLVHPSTTSQPPRLTPRTRKPSPESAVPPQARSIKQEQKMQKPDSFFIEHIVVVI